MKKPILFTLLSLLSLGCFAQQGVWFTQASGFTPVSSGVRYISVVDTNTVWVVPYDGDPNTGGLPRQDFSLTTNGGAVFTAGTVPTTTSWDWAMIHGFDNNKAWAVFFSAVTLNLGQIWHTSDGGASWTQQGVNTFTTAGESFVNVIHFFNDTDGVVIGDPISTGGNHYEIYTTTDGGTNWLPVSMANIPAPLNNEEAGWTTHIETKGDTVWFDTNFGRVYRSIDRGYTWTVSNTNLINFRGSIDITFQDALNGVARYHNDTTAISTFVSTSDGGDTWSAPFIGTGKVFGSSIKAVPGTSGMYVSTGAQVLAAPVPEHMGSSYSLDACQTWTTLDSTIQHTALGIADSLTMWSGGFSASPTSGGIFKWIVINPVSCNDVNINSGITLASDTALCQGDTVFFNTSGIYSPVNGDFSGFCIALSSQDISGSLDPNNAPGYIGSYPFAFPPPNDFDNFFINDTLLIDGVTLPFGMYYFTPVVFGNATAAATPTTRLFDLNLDPNCTYTGTSVAVNVQDWGIPPCSPVGISELYSSLLTINATIKGKSTMYLNISSAKSGKANVQVLDLTGRILIANDYSVNEGRNLEMINVDNLSQGTYLVKVEMNGVKTTGKVFKY